MIALESLYRPIRHIPNIRAPVLYLAATNDTLIPLESVTKAVRATPDGQLYTVKSSHFGVYSGVPFPYLVQHTIGFLREKNGMKRLILSSAEAAGMGR
jgi:dienelactone hydrolase